MHCFSVNSNVIFFLNRSKRNTMQDYSNNAEGLEGKIKNLATILEEKGIDYKDIFEQTGLSSVINNDNEN